MSRLYGAGVPITVEVDVLGQPCRIEWEGEVWESVQVADRWRVDEEWWEGRTWREYFKCEIKPEKQLVLIYRNLQDGRWHLQRVYD